MQSDGWRLVAKPGKLDTERKRFIFKRKANRWLRRRKAQSAEQTAAELTALANEYFVVEGPADVPVGTVPMSSEALFDAIARLEVE